MHLGKFRTHDIYLISIQSMKIAKILVAIFFVGAALVFTPGTVFAASLSLSPASATKAVGTNFTVDIVLDTDGDAVSGVTAIINYDKDKLAVVDGDSAAAGVNITPGGNLTQVLTNSVNASTGQIRYDAGNLGSPYTGRGTIASINFQAKSVGNAQAAFVFNASSTTNTSAVAAASGPTNLLVDGELNDGNYTITSGTGGGNDDELPQTGVVEDTIMFLTGGLVFLGAGFALIRKALL